MTKFYSLETIVTDKITIHYFYYRESNDRNGNSRYSVFIINPTTNEVTVKLVQTYDVTDWVRSYIESPQYIKTPQ